MYNASSFPGNRDFLFFVNESMRYCHLDCSGFEKKEKRTEVKRKQLNLQCENNKLTITLKDDRDI